MSPQNTQIPTSMKIAILIHPYGRFGGAERLAILHAKELQKAGFDVTFYTDIASMDPAWISKIPTNVPVVDLPFGLRALALLPDLGSFQRLVIHHHIDPILALRITRKYGDRTYWYTGEVLRAIWEDEITGEDYRQFSPTVYGTASHFYGRASSLPLSAPLYKSTISILKLVDMATVGKYKRVIANSRYMANTARRIYRYTKPILIAYPAPSLQSTMIRPNYGGGYHISTIGALLPNKNHGMLIAAISLLRNPPELRIVGEGQERSRLEAQAKKLGVNATFQSNLRDDELCRVYENSLFVVVPSRSEPFGMTTLEAALAGKPSVVTAQGGAKEFVMDKETGFVVPSTSVIELAQRIDCLLNNFRLRERMGQKARERVLSLFTLEKSTLALSRALDL